MVGVGRAPRAVTVKQLSRGCFGSFKWPLNLKYYQTSTTEWLRWSTIGWMSSSEWGGGYYRRLVPPLNHHSFSHFLCFLQHQHEQRTRITIPGQPLFSRLALARARLTNDRLGAPPHTTRQLIPSTSAHRDPDLITSPLFIIQISSGRSATSMRASQFRFGKYGHVRSRSGLADWDTGLGESASNTFQYNCRTRLELHPNNTTFLSLFLNC